MNVSDSDPILDILSSCVGQGMEPNNALHKAKVRIHYYKLFQVCLLKFHYF